MSVLFKFDISNRIMNWFGASSNLNWTVASGRMAGLICILHGLVSLLSTKPRTEPLFQIHLLECFLKELVPTSA